MKLVGNTVKLARPRTAISVLCSSVTATHERPSLVGEQLAEAKPDHVDRRVRIGRILTQEIRPETIKTVRSQVACEHFFRCRHVRRNPFLLSVV